MTGSVFAPPFAKYNADGSGRDTYIRRDPVECYGKSLYKTPAPVVTRFGAAGSVLPRDRPKRPGATDPVGGESGVAERPARFLRKPHGGYPIEVAKFTTIKELLQDACVTTCPAT